MADAYARNTIIALAAAAGLVLLAGPAAAQDSGESSGTWTLQLENDRFSNTDRHYTHGTRVSWVSPAAHSDPQWVAELLHDLYPFEDLRQGRVGLAFGQNIYTPENTDATALIRDDRPYAGWLYGAISVHAETSSYSPEGTPDTLDTVELQAGMVGPYAFAEEVQNGFHELINVSESQGWDNQLDNEPGIMLVGERRWRSHPLDILGFEADAIPNVGAAVGNVMTFANVGMIARFGSALDADYGPPLIRPSLSGLASIDEKRDFGWYVFAGLQGRAIARNIFLDGNTFSDSHSVDKKYFVGDFQFGVAILVDGVRIALTQVYRTREYEGQDKPDRYGAFSVSARF